MSKSSTITRRATMPNRVTTHPGEVLSEEFLKPLGMSVNALAMALRVPATRIGAIAMQGRAVGEHGGYRLAARAFLRDESGVLDGHAGDARFDQGAPRTRTGDRTRRATEGGVGNVE